MSLPNPHPEARGRHPHRRRLPRHARHLIDQLLRVRVATRASVVVTHARQLDSAINLREDRSRLHPDTDRHTPGVRVVVGPETRSLLRQLLASRDLRVQQQLVREILHQLQRRVLAALKRVKRIEKTMAAAQRGARAVRRSRLWSWFAALPRRVRDRAARIVARGDRPRRGSRTTTRLSRSTRVTRVRIPGPETREMLAAGRLGRTGMHRVKRDAAAERPRRTARK